MSEFASVAGAGGYRRVEVKRVVNASIKKVWKAITNQDEVAQWWAAGVIETKEGGRIRLGDSDEYCEEDGLALDGEIKVFQPPHIFEFTWNEAYQPAMGLVRFDLVELDDNTTLITLIQSVPSKDVIAAAAGWHQLSDRLGDYLLSGEFVPVPEDDSRFKELTAAYSSALR